MVPSRLERSCMVELEVFSWALIASELAVKDLTVAMSSSMVL
jgi:hypothetical protein